MLATYRAVSKTEAMASPMTPVQKRNKPRQRARSHTDYAPFITRTPFLLFVCGCVFACIAGFQVILSKSTVAGGRSYQPSSQGETQRTGDTTTLPTTLSGQEVPPITITNADKRDVEVSDVMPQTDTVEYQSKQSLSDNSKGNKTSDPFVSPYPMTITSTTTITTAVDSSQSVNQGIAVVTPGISKSDRSSSSLGTSNKTIISSTKTRSTATVSVSSIEHHVINPDTENATVVTPKHDSKLKSPTFTVDGTSPLTISSAADSFVAVVSDDTVTHAESTSSTTLPTIHSPLSSSPFFRVLDTIRVSSLTESPSSSSKYASEPTATTVTNLESNSVSRVVSSYFSLTSSLSSTIGPDELPTTTVEADQKAYEFRPSSSPVTHDNEHRLTTSDRAPTIDREVVLATNTPSASYLPSSPLPSASGALPTTGRDSFDVILTSFATLGATLQLNHMSETSIVAYSDPPTATKSIPTSTANTNDIFPPPPADATKRLPIKTRAQHYCATYAPTLAIVLLKILWALVYGSNKMMEPFYQLSNPQGASVDDLMADYLSPGISWQSFKTMSDGHWVIILTTINAILLGVLPGLATESMKIQALDLCTHPDGMSLPCNSVLILDAHMIRVTQAILGAIVFCVLLIIILNMRRHSGIKANPSSIITMATLLHHPRTVDQIRTLRETHGKSEIAAALAGCRFHITTYVDDAGIQQLGLVKTAVSPGLLQHDGDHYSLEMMSSEGDFRMRDVVRPVESMVDRRRSRGGFSVLLDFMLVIFMVGIMIVALNYWVEREPTPFNNFFHNQKFGPRFLLTSAATVVAMIWLDIEREARIQTPYRALARGNATAQKTILLTVNGFPYGSLVTSIFRGNYLHFSVALACILGDVLIVAVSGIPFSSGRMHSELVGSMWLTIGILAYMIVVTMAVFHRRQSNNRMDIPLRVNDTVLSMWMALANEDNKILAMANAVRGEQDQKERDAHIVAYNATFFAGWITESDGRRRWCVDVESPQEHVAVNDDRDEWQVQSTSDRHEEDDEYCRHDRPGSRSYTLERTISDVSYTSHVPDRLNHADRREDVTADDDEDTHNSSVMM